MKTVSEVGRSIEVQTLVYECTELELHPLRHSQPMKLLQQRRNMIIPRSSVNHASRCIDNRLKPIELVCWQSSKYSVAVIQPCQDQRHNQSDKRKYGGLKVENRQFVPTHPHSTPSFGVTPFEFRDEPDIDRNYRIMGLPIPYGEETMIVWP